MIEVLHISFAFLTATGFIIRAGWTYVAPDLLEEKWVRVAPHIVDTLLLLCGVTLALNLPGGIFQTWLIAKMIGLLGYIGFGVMCLRGSGARRTVGLVGALVCLTYIFSVAITKSSLLF
ncbi:MAG: SirB2 family protein [Pseudomonadota bacterium]